MKNDNGNGYKKTCKIFDCKKSTLRDWVKRYKSSNNLTRKNRKPISYKITKPHVKNCVRNNNQTIKKTIHVHFPMERYKKPIDKQIEMNAFYKRIKHYPLNKIICLD